MILKHVLGILTQPEKEWANIRDEKCTVGSCYLNHVILLAAIPPICAYIGATHIGWKFGAGATVKLTADSGLMLGISFYAALLIAIFIMGKAIHWMGQTFDAKAPLEKCVVVAAYTATPLFISGLIALYPVLWLDMLVGLAALSYTVYLLYMGLPIVMKISKEQGFLFASGILTVGLVTLVGMLAVTVLMWLYGGFMPTYTN